MHDAPRLKLASNTGIQNSHGTRVYTVNSSRVRQVLNSWKPVYLINNQRSCTRVYHSSRKKQISSYLLGSQHLIHAARCIGMKKKMLCAFIEGFWYIIQKRIIWGSLLAVFLRVYFLPWNFVAAIEESVSLFVCHELPPLYYQQFRLSTDFSRTARQSRAQGRSPTSTFPSWSQALNQVKERCPWGGAGKEQNDRNEHQREDVN